MQTVFDQTLKVLIQSFLSLSLTSWLVFVKATEKYDETIALIITKCHYFIFVWTYLWALVFVLTRYVIIFHHEVMDNIEDSKYIKVRFLNISQKYVIDQSNPTFQTSKLMVGLFSFSATMIEDLEHGLVYSYLTNSDPNTEDLNNLKVFKFILTLFVLTVFFVQVKIWIFKVGQGFNIGI